MDVTGVVILRLPLRRRRLRRRRCCSTSSSSRLSPLFASCRCHPYSLFANRCRIVFLLQLWFVVVVGDWIYIIRFLIQSIKTSSLNTVLNYTH